MRTKPGKTQGRRAAKARMSSLAHERRNVEVDELLAKADRDSKYSLTHAERDLKRNRARAESWLKENGGRFADPSHVKGGPDELDIEAAREFLKDLRLGVPAEMAATMAGIEPARLRQWFEFANGGQEPFAEFVRVASAAETACNEELLAPMRRAALTRPSVKRWLAKRGLG